MFLLAISPGTGLEPSRWERVLASGVDALMIRERAMSPDELLRTARWVQARAPGVELWVNGSLEVALAAGCGFHAPEAFREELPGHLPVSRPIHEAGQLAQRALARQLILSPIFAVPGKGPAWGAEKLHRVLDGMPAGSFRALALGGITPANAGALRHPRLAGVALIRGLWEVPDPQEAVSRLREAWP
jgi:thiamine-phosphate pyrophosphorylase